MGVATSLVNYNSINEFALRTNLRTPRSDELISDAQHVRVRERQKERERERLCAKRKKQNKVDAPKIRGKSTRAAGNKARQKSRMVVKNCAEHCIKLSGNNGRAGSMVDAVKRGLVFHFLCLLSLIACPAVSSARVCAATGLLSLESWRQDEKE